MVALADADFDYTQKSRRLDVDAKGNFTYLDYLQGAYGSQLIGRFDGMAHLAIIPERIVWVLQDDFGQAAIDPVYAGDAGQSRERKLCQYGSGLCLALRREQLCECECALCPCAICNESVQQQSAARHPRLGTASYREDPAYR